MGGSLIREGLPMWTSENRAQYDRDKLRMIEKAVAAMPIGSDK
jgi:hypothetical protein